jgi:hypothetical protein
MCHTELIEPLGRFAIGVGEISRVQAPVDLYYSLMIGEMLVRKAHPFKEFAILGEGVELAVAEALDMTAHPQGTFISHLAAFIGRWHAPAIRLGIAPEVFFEELSQRLLQAIADVQRSLAPWLD